MVAAELIDPLEEMNAANSAGIAGIINVAIGADAAPAAGPPAPAGAVGGNLGGLKNGMPGVSEDVPNAGAADDCMATLTGSLDPDQPISGDQAGETGFHVERRRPDGR